jgi:hypothetical protein
MITNWVDYDYREKFDLPGEADILMLIADKYGGTICDRDLRSGRDLRSVLGDYGDPDEIITDLLNRKIVRPLKTKKFRVASHIGNGVELNTTYIGVIYSLDLPGIALYNYHRISPEVCIQ